jgi:hypothetical protein
MWVQDVKPDALKSLSKEHHFTHWGNGENNLSVFWHHLALPEVLDECLSYSLCGIFKSVNPNYRCLGLFYRV